MADRIRSGPALAAILALAACSSGTSTSSPSLSASSSTNPSQALPSPSPSAGPTLYTSTLYGYSLTLPAGWSAFGAAVRWDGKGAPGHDSAVVDQLAGSGLALAWIYAGPTTEDLAGFAQATIAAIRTDHSDTCPAAPEAEEPIQIGGEPATLLAWNCGILVNVAVTVHHGVGFFIGYQDRAVHAATDATDRAFLNLLLGTLRLPN